jgi:hypothetical protein
LKDLVLNATISSPEAMLIWFETNDLRNQTGGPSKPGGTTKKSSKKPTE